MALAKRVEFKDMVGVAGFGDADPVGGAEGGGEGQRFGFGHRRQMRGASGGEAARESGEEFRCALRSVCQRADEEAVPRAKRSRAVGVL